MAGGVIGLKNRNFIFSTFLKKLSGPLAIISILLDFDIFWKKEGFGESSGRPRPRPKRSRSCWLDYQVQ